MIPQAAGLILPVQLPVTENVSSKQFRVSAHLIDKRGEPDDRFGRHALVIEDSFGKFIIIEREISAMAVTPSQRLVVDTTVVSLTTVQRALWQLGMPILDAAAVAEYKKRSKLVMLWHAIRWHLLSMAALVAVMCIGRQWSRVATVAAAAVLLATLFGWLMNASELLWQTIGYSTYRNLYPVPPHVAATADALLSSGVSEMQIGVEYLKNDPILYVEDAEQGHGVQRHDLIIW
jgi:hypothetical protein